MSTNYTRLHKHHHDDYALAKEHIRLQLGDIEDISIFGRNVLVAVYLRPLLNPATGVYSTEKEQTEDTYSGKSCMILKCGPGAFQGDDEYLADTYGPLGPPKVGDWVFHSQSVGVPISLCGTGAISVTEKDKFGEAHRAYYMLSGWPCRIVPDSELLGRLDNPHGVI